MKKPTKFFWCNVCIRKMVSTTYQKNWIWCYYCGSKAYPLKNSNNKKCKSCNIKIHSKNESMLCRGCWRSNYYVKVVKPRHNLRKRPQISSFAKANYSLLLTLVLIFKCKEVLL